MKNSRSTPLLPSLEHLAALTDDIGVIQHAVETIPNRATGYCTDDVARALHRRPDAAAGRPARRNRATLGLDVSRVPLCTHSSRMGASTTSWATSGAGSTMSERRTVSDAPCGRSDSECAMRRPRRGVAFAARFSIAGSARSTRSSSSIRARTRFSASVMPTKRCAIRRTPPPSATSRIRCCAATTPSAARIGSGSDRP